MRSDWLTPKVREALEACPVSWDEPDGRHRILTQGIGLNCEIWEALPNSITFWLDGFHLPALVEKHWREECERRGISLHYDSVDNEWAWATAYDEDGISTEWHMDESGDGWSLLDCLADAILSTQPKEAAK